jgi:hypothetical protein
MTGCCGWKKQKPITILTLNERARDANDINTCSHGGFGGSESQPDGCPIDYKISSNRERSV